LFANIVILIGERNKILPMLVFGIYLFHYTLAPIPVMINIKGNVLKSGSEIEPARPPGHG
jgi:hypothetical protein